MTTYTLAIGDGLLLATVPDGADIDAAVETECNLARIKPPKYETIEGCTLTDELSDELVDEIELVWASGSCGWLMDEIGNTWRYAIHTK
jgi:hypothetical protein